MSRFISYSGDSDEHALIKYFNHYIHQLGVGMIICFTGSEFLKTGVGKSLGAGRLGEMLDGKFSIDDYVYEAIDYVKINNAIEEENIKGRVIVIDEGEITGSNRAYHSFFNKLLTHTAATNRYLNTLTIICCPEFDSIDKRLRFLVSHLAEFDKTLVTGGKIKVKMKLYRLETNQFTGKRRKRRIIMWNKKLGRLVRFNSFVVNLPSDRLVEAYDKVHRGFKKNLRDELIKEAHALETLKRTGVITNPEEILERIANDRSIIMQITTARGKVSSDLVKRHFNINFSDARIVKDKLEKQQKEWLKETPEPEGVKL